MDCDPSWSTEPSIVLHNIRELDLFMTEGMCRAFPAGDEAAFFSAPLLCVLCGYNVVCVAAKLLLLPDPQK